MTNPDRFHLTSTHAAAHAAQLAFTELGPNLTTLLPPQAIIEHVGATAVPGCLTKGDLDICVSIPAALFATADLRLASMFDRNTGSIRNTEFSSFCDEHHVPPLGIQLVAARSALDVFVRFRDLLRDDGLLLTAYNALKVHYDGQDMHEYRAAKSAFIQSALGSRAQ